MITNIFKLNFTILFRGTFNWSDIVGFPTFKPKIVYDSPIKINT